LRVGRGEDETLVRDAIDVGCRIAHGLAAAVEAEVAVADVVEQENDDVGTLAGFLLQRFQLFRDLLLLVGVRDHRLHPCCPPA